MTPLQPAADALCLTVARSGGYYCPNVSVAIICPKGYFCKAQVGSGLSRHENAVMQKKVREQPCVPCLFLLATLYASDRMSQPKDYMVFS